MGDWGLGDWGIGGIEGLEDFSLSEYDIIS